MSRSSSVPISLDDSRPAFLVERIEQIAPKALAFLVLCVVAGKIAVAASTPLWNDEILTSIIARQPSLSVLWQALANGADGQPPAYYLVERLFDALIPNEHIALRLPSIIALCSTMVCVFSFVSKRSGGLRGLICTFVLLNTILFDTYATEARPYGLVVAAIAFALLSYQRVASPFWILMLGFSLVLAVSMHYYALFALPAFAVAEGVYYLGTRRLRVWVWLALGCAVLPMAAFWPLLDVQRKIFGPHMWAHPRLFVALDTYGYFFHLPAPVGLAFAGVLGLGLIAKGNWNVILGERTGPQSETLIHEQTLVLSLLLMPVVVFVVTRMTHGAFLERYLLWVILAMAIIPGYLFAEKSPKSLLASVLFLSATLAGQLALSLYSIRGHLGRVASPAVPVEKFIASARYPELPVFVSSNNDYVVLRHYASPEWAARFVAIVDPSSAVAYIGTDTSDKELPILAAYSPFRVYKYSDFILSHSAFLMYSTSSGATAGPFGYYDWWVPRLVQAGYTLRVVAAEGNSRVYLVNRSPEASEKR